MPGRVPEDGAACDPPIACSISLGRGSVIFPVSADGAEQHACQSAEHRSGGTHHRPPDDETKAQMPRVQHDRDQKTSERADADPEDQRA